MYVHAIRMMESASGRPMRDLFMYKTENAVLNLDDYMKLKNYNGYEFIQSFNTGCGTFEEVQEKYPELSFYIVDGV